MSKRALLASAIAACACVASSAQAGEWSGFYIGVHAGGMWGDVDTTNKVDGYTFWPVSPGSSVALSPDGVLGGAQLGYNFQFTNWLIGLEVTGSGMDFDETIFLSPDDLYGVDAEWLATAAARLGFTWNQSLLYVKGGYAAGSIQTNELDNTGGFRGAFSTDETHSGWIAGAGWEHMISPDVSIGVEYNYIDLGNQDHSAIPHHPITGLTIPPGSRIVNDVDVQVQTVTARLNWHWNPY